MNNCTHRKITFIHKTTSKILVVKLKKKVSRLGSKTFVYILDAASVGIINSHHL